MTLQVPCHRQHARDLRQLGLKTRIEAGDLRNPGEMFLRTPDDRERRRRMQRGEGGGGVKFSQHHRIQQAMLQMLRAAMHDAMRNGVRCRQLALEQEICDTNDGVFLRRNRRFIGSSI